MAVPNIFASATSAIPLSQLDQNFATAITLGNTAVYLGNTTTSLGNVTLTNVTISSGNVTLTGANVSGTANVSTLIVTGNQTSLGNVAITGNVSANIATFSAGTAALPAITTTGDTNTGIWFPAADTIAFTEGGVESMRIDSSGNVGIGTSSPNAPLVIGTPNTVIVPVSASVSGVTPAVNSGKGILQIGSTDAVAVDKGGILTFTANTTTQNGFTMAGIAGKSEATGAGVYSGYLQFITTNAAGGVAEKMRLDASGNLGLGVTPSAFGAGRWMQFLTVSAVGQQQNGTANLMCNAYESSSNSFNYIVTAAAARYNAQAGAHAWFTAPSGTAGNAITFTQAMTLDASGKLGIGTSSPAEKLSVAGSITATDVFIPTNGATAIGYIGNSNSITGGSATNIGLRAEAAMLFATGGSTERARIDTSGNLLVGTTATVSAGPTSRVISYAGSASTAAISAQYGNSYTGQLYRADSLTTSGTGWSYFMGLSGNGTSITTTQIQILGNGNIQNTNNSYGAISDIKRKENITDATPKLEKLNQVRVVNFNMIGEEQKQLGVIAQELEQVFPSMIEETPDRDVEGNDLGTTTKSVKYSVFVPMLIKAMQEQQALITTLTARITALESA